MHIQKTTPPSTFINNPLTTSVGVSTPIKQEEEDYDDLL